VIDAGEIEERLLLALAGGLPSEDLAAWARGAIAFDAGEGPALFAGDDEILRDVLKRCAIATEPGFELTSDDIRRMLRRIAWSAPGLAPRGRRDGPFLVALRARGAPARLFPIAGNCARCGAAVRVSGKALPKAARTRGALACVWCARALPGAVVGKL
jgi:hypothetical protein